MSTDTDSDSETGAEARQTEAGAETAPTETHDSAATVGHELEAERTTAPQSSYTGREVGIGLVVLALGLLVTIGVPMLVFW